MLGNFKLSLYTVLFLENFALIIDASICCSVNGGFENEINALVEAILK